MATKQQKQQSDQESGSNEPETRGVPDDIREQLAHDIQKAGGIANFDKGSSQALDDILNSNPDKYKTRGHPLRRKICNLVYSQWKRWTPEKYSEEVLLHYRVPNYARGKSKNKSKSEPIDSKESTTDNNINSNHFASKSTNKNTSIPPTMSMSVVAMFVF